MYPRVGYPVSGWNLQTRTHHEHFIQDTTPNYRITLLYGSRIFFLTISSRFLLCTHDTHRQHTHLYIYDLLSFVIICVYFFVHWYKCLNFKWLRKRFFSFYLSSFFFFLRTGWSLRRCMRWRNAGVRGWYCSDIWTYKPMDIAANFNTYLHPCVCARVCIIPPIHTKLH